MPAAVAGPTLDDTLDAIGALRAHGAPLAPAAALGAPPTAGDGWVPAAALLGEDDAPREALLARAAADAGPRRDVAATLAAQGVAWALAAPAVAAVVLRRRLPGLTAERTALRLGDGWVPTAAGLGGEVRVLPADPLAGAPDAVPVADEAALLDALWTDLEALLARLLAGLSRATRRPERALWRVAHDAVASAFLTAGEAAGRREDARALWHAAAGRAPARLRGRARPVDLAVPGGGRAPLLLRAGCCLIWRAGTGAPTCAGCPLTPDEERAARLAGHREETS